MTPKKLRQKSVNFAIQWMREFFPNKAVYPGTGLRDTLINSFAGMTWNFWKQIDDLKAAMNISNYATVSRTSLNRAAEFWFLPQSSERKATTVWRMFFSAPSYLRLPVGTTVGGNGLRYMTTSVNTFSKSVMGNNANGALYYVDFPVTAVLPGDQYNVAANTLHDVYSPMSVSVISSTNIIPATGGSSFETSAQYYARLNAGINTRQNLITKSSMISTLLAEFPSFDNINIQGKGDEFMMRDKRYGISGTGGQAPYTKSDFYFIEETHSYARKTSSEDPLPSLESLKNSDYTSPFTDEDYKLIAKHDLKFFTKLGGMIYSETFASSPVDYKVGDWLISDSGYPHGEKKYGNSSCINSRGLVLGVPSKTELAIEVS